jgi:hypothetical protein
MQAVNPTRGAWGHRAAAASPAADVVDVREQQECIGSAAGCSVGHTDPSSIMLVLMEKCRSSTAVERFQ